MANYLNQTNMNTEIKYTVEYCRGMYSNIAIWCPTFDDYIAVCKIAGQNSPNGDLWTFSKDQTCLTLTENGKIGVSLKDIFKINNYTIVPASIFLADNAHAELEGWQKEWEILAFNMHRPHDLAITKNADGSYTDSSGYTYALQYMLNNPASFTIYSIVNRSKNKFFSMGDKVVCKDTTFHIHKITIGSVRPWLHSEDEPYSAPMCQPYSEPSYSVAYVAEKPSDLGIHVAAIAKWGTNRQVDKIFEEMAELQKALLKLRHCEADGIDKEQAYQDVVDEHADLLNTLRYLEVIYGADHMPKVAAAQSYKLSRLGKFLNV